MDNELPIKQDELSQLTIDDLELLTRFILKCKKEAENKEHKSHYMCIADLVSAVYYYRKYPDVNEFITKYLANNSDYFQIQWVRNTWNKLSKMTEAELSELVINQIKLVDNFEEG